MSLPGGLDWPGLMRAGIGRLGLRPAEFWALSPAELALMLGIEAVAPPMGRARLEALLAQWPDAPRAAGDAGAPHAAVGGDQEGQDGRG